jgi:hypothetical protein
VARTYHPLFSNFLFTNLFSIKFLYFFIISSLFPYFNLFVKVYLDNIEVRTVNVNRYVLLLFKVYLDNIEVRTVNVNRYVLLLFKVYLYNIEVRTVNVTNIC